MVAVQWPREVLGVPVEPTDHAPDDEHQRQAE